MLCENIIKNLGNLGNIILLSRLSVSTKNLINVNVMSMCLFWEDHPDHLMKDELLSFSNLGKNDGRLNYDYRMHGQTVRKQFINGL